nr:hypothetical protein [Tanacetum cinerariifolium]
AVSSSINLCLTALSSSPAALKHLVFFFKLISSINSKANSRKIKRINNSFNPPEGVNHCTCLNDEYQSVAIDGLISLWSQDAAHLSKKYFIVDSPQFKVKDNEEACLSIQQVRELINYFFHTPYVQVQDDVNINSVVKEEIVKDDVNVNSLVKEAGYLLFTSTFGLIICGNSGNQMLTEQWQVHIYVICFPGFNFLFITLMVSNTLSLCLQTMFKRCTFPSMKRILIGYLELHTSSGLITIYDNLGVLLME